MTFQPQPSLPRHKEGGGSQQTFRVSGLSAMLARRGIRIYCPWRAALPKSEEISERDALLNATYQGNDRQQLNRSASDYCRATFGVWA